MIRRIALLAGPALFTAAWLGLGWSHPGYSQIADSISVLAAYGAPGAAFMTAALLAQAAAIALAARRLRSVSRPAAALLLVNAVATVVVAAARIPCRAGDAAWCRPSDHPTSYAVHVVAATVALSALSLAPLLAAAGTRRSAPTLAATGVAASAVMLALLAWFAVAEGAGWAEKAVVTVGIWWAAAVAATVWTASSADRVA